MSKENVENRSMRKQKKTDRLKRLLGIDLCACGGGHKIRCKGVCRERHTNSKTGKIECVALYQIDNLVVGQDDQRGRGKSWKYGRQKNTDDSVSDKDQRRKKRERDRSE